MNQKLTERIPVPVPPLGEQRKISAILSSIDKAIESSQAVIDQLQVVKKSMMAELLTRGIPGRHTKFKMTEIGEVPGEWEVVPLESLASKITDGEHQTPRRTTEGVLLLSARNVLDGALSLDEVDYVDELEYERIARRCCPEEGDILISCSGTVGRVCLVPPGLRFGLVRSVALVKPRRAIVNVDYLHHVLPSDILQTQMHFSKKQAAQANLFQGPIRRLSIPMPPMDEQEWISAVLSAVDGRVISERLQSSALSALKIALMSGLLSGEIRVTPVEVSP